MQTRPAIASAIARAALELRIEDGSRRVRWDAKRNRVVLPLAFLDQPLVVADTDQRRVAAIDAVKDVAERVLELEVLRLWRDVEAERIGERQLADDVEGLRRHRASVSAVEHVAPTASARARSTFVALADICSNPGIWAAAASASGPGSLQPVRTQAAINAATTARLHRQALLRRHSEGPRGRGHAHAAFQGPRMGGR